VIVARKFPQAVICLVSALAFHELTTQVPHAIDVALPSRAERPVLDYPPIRTFWFSGRAWSEGIQTYQVDDTAVRIYNPEKSVAESWKYRHKLGLDVALEALKLYHQRRDFDVTRLVEYARRVACRVEKVMRPYPEALM
jgi:predicted transcriptional regulator of viral defense system